MDCAKIKFKQLLAPIADAFAGGYTSPVTKVTGYEKVCYRVNLGASTGGTARHTYYLELAKGNSLVKIPFEYRCGTGSAAAAGTDVEGSVTAAVSISGTGSISAANSRNNQIIIWPNLQTMAMYPEADGIRIVLTEDVDDPVVAGISVDLYEPKFNRAGDLPGAYYMSGTGGTF